MTKQTDPAMEASDRPAFEITEEMVKAGVEAINQRLCDARVQAAVSSDDVAFALQEILRAA